MKKLLPAFLLLLAATTYAQNCTPSWSGGSYGIQPDSATNLPHAQQMQPYSAIIQFKVPADTVLFGQAIPIDSVTIDSVGGLSSIPATVPFTYMSNPTNGHFPGGSLGCVVIHGTAASGSGGTYPLIVKATGHATILGFSTPFPKTVTYYRIVVDYGAGVDPMDVRAKGLIALPTLTGDYTTLHFFTPVSDAAQIIVSNVLGHAVMSETVTANAGNNTYNLNMESLQSGAYFVTVKTNAQSHTTKVTLSK